MTLAAKRTGIGLALLLAWVSGCGPRQPDRALYQFQGGAMGTSFSVKVVSDPLSSEQERAIDETIRRELEEVNARMSTYLETSELSRLNRWTAPGPLAVSPELLAVLLVAKEAGQATRGAYDITIGPLVNAWGFGPKGSPPAPPPDAELTRLRQLTGWDKIEIDQAQSTVRKAAPEIFLDLSGVAKGYAVDRVAEALIAMNCPHHLVEVGGEVRARGVNERGVPWRIGIETPVAGARRVQRALALDGLAMATSGDYRNFHELDGARYAHIIDPRTAKPVRHSLASVSVIDAACARADAFATGLMVLGGEEGLSVAEECNLAALFLIRESDGKLAERSTSRFRELFGEGMRP